MAEIVTMGEIMLRLSPPEHQRFIQATSFDINYGGSEGNIAVCLSNYGHNVGYITKLPKNEIGECVIATLQKYGVDCSAITRGGNRLGIYFLENGSSVRPSSVIYDRAGRVVKQTTADSEGRYDVRDLKAGVYFVVVKAGALSKSIKLIKK